MTEPARSPAEANETEPASNRQLDPTREWRAGDSVPPSRQTDPEPNFAPPEKAGEVGLLGRYRILKKLGRGGMGAVYLAYDFALGRRIALKVMLPQFAAKPEFRERFLREARAAAMVRSDHIVTIYDVGEERGIPFIAMEHLRGQPLDRYLLVKGNLPLGQVLRVTRETALGLAAAHEQGLVHRDVKPGNIWLEAPRGRVKLLDFGLARAVDDDTHLTGTGHLVGTPAFMSPEQARGLKLDPRSDLFSLGVLLYLLATGKMPFSGTTTMAVLTSLAVDTAPPAREANPDLPEALEAIVAKLLAKNPADRFSTALEVAAALRAAEKSRPVAGQVPVDRKAPALTIREESETVWEGIEASGASPRVLEAGTKPVPAHEPGPSDAPKKRVRTPSTLAARGKSPPDVFPRMKTSGFHGRCASVIASLRSRRPFIHSLLAVILAGAMLLAAGTVLAAIFLWPAKGTLVVESDDPAAEVVVKKGGEVVRGRTKNREIALSTGAYIVELAAPKAGLTLSPHKVEVVKNTRTRVRIIADKPSPPVPEPPVVNAPAAEPPAVNPPVASDPDRQAAEYALSVGGFVGITVDGQLLEVRVPGDLPNKPFALTILNLSRRTAVTDTGLAAVKGCKNIHILYLNESIVTDAGLAHFAGCTSLFTLELYRTATTDAGLAYFAECKNLTRLAVDHTRITDAGLAHFAGCRNVTRLAFGGTPTTDAGLVCFKECRNLNYLDVQDTKVTDVGLDPFKECKGLTTLFVQGTRVTAAKVEELHEALPQCTIVWDGGRIGPQ